MYYLIDGNNLAGSLGLLDEDDFNDILIELLEDFLDDNRKKAILVFDSNNPMGDYFEKERLKIIYAPRDENYESADDKIIEIAREEDPDEGLILITNDIALREEIEIINKEQNRKNEIIIISSTEFKRELGEEDASQEEDEEDFSEDAIDEINNELLNEWT